ncbi:MAG TPA: hypothetical protein VFA34_11155 [Actinomycetota bacterium]|nr:hypothetical protein [Actinomycetota bacterium]
MGESRIPLAYEDALETRHSGVPASIEPGGRLRRIAVQLRRRPALWAFISLAAAQVAAVPWHLWLARGNTFYAEELGYALDFEGLGSGLVHLWAGWFFPLTLLVYNIVFSTSGLETYLPLQIFSLLCNAALVWAVFWYCRRISRPWAGATLGVFLLCFGYATETVLLPAMAYNAIGVAALPASLALLLRDRRSADRGAFAILLVAMGFAGPVFLTACVGVGIWLLLQQPVSWRRLYVAGIPALAYALIYAISIATQETLSVVGGGVEGGLLAIPRNLLNAPAYILEAGSTAGAAIAGIGRPLGNIFFPIGLAAMWIGAKRVSRETRAHVLALFGAALSAWLLLAATRAPGQFGSASAQRYVIYGAVPLLLIGVHLTKDVPTLGRGIVFVLIAASVALNSAALTRFAEDYRLINEVQRARYAALDLLGSRAPAEYNPSRATTLSLDVIDAHHWIDIRRRLGSFAFRLSELPSAHAAARNEFDRVLREAGGIKISSELLEEKGGPSASCTSGWRATELTLPRNGIDIAATEEEWVTLGFRRLGNSYQQPPNGIVPSGKRVRVTPVADALRTPWAIVLKGHFRACEIAPSAQAG